MLIQKTTKLIKEYNIPLAVIADIDKKQIEYIGEIIEMFVDLYDMLFADIERAEVLCRSLEGQLLPRIWMQGDVFCIVCKPTHKLAIGLFYQDVKCDDVEQYHWSKQIDAEIQAIWGDPTGVG